MSDADRDVLSAYAGRQVKSKSAEERAELRWSKPLRFARTVVEHAAERARASQELLGRSFYRGDCHSHTQHSDGVGTVEESAEMARAAGLDFFWVTDHGGRTQAPECEEHGLWVGQEPTSELYHLGILGLDHTYAPTGEIARDFEYIHDHGGTPFVPHPAGWWPTKVYTAEQKDLLRTLRSPFLMEVVNGAGNLVTAYDYTDAAAVELWDELLCEGRVVHAMGNTDAHSPHQIGIVWNGVYADRCDEDSIVAALRAGRCFASEAPVFDLRIGAAGMGERVKDRESAGPLAVRAADSHGLLQVRLIADGAVAQQWLPDGETVVAYEGPVPSAAARYVRVEAVSMDGRRGFSNPVYL